MILALYVIGSTAGLLLLSARLREARDELARVREECDDRAQAVRDEYGAYAHGVAMSLSCLLAGLGAVRWYAGPASPPPSSAGGQADAPGREAAP